MTKPACQAPGIVSQASRSSAAACSGGFSVIKILSPNPMESGKAEFEVTCAGAGKIEPPKAGGSDRPTNPGTIKGFNPQPEPPARKVQ